MINPQAYSIELPNYANTAMQGFQQGAQTMGYFQDRERAAQQAELERQKAQQMQADLSDLANNPTPENYTKYMTLYPQLSENFKRGYDTMTDSAKRRSTKTAVEVSTLLNAGDTMGAKQTLERLATAYENAGDVGQAQSNRALAKLVETNPELAKASAFMIAGQGLDGEQFAEFTSKLGTERRAEAKLQPEIDKLEAETAKTETETEWLPQINQANISNIESQIEDRTTGRVLQNKQIENQNRQFYDNLDQGQKQFLMKLDQSERKLANDLNPTKPETAEKRIERLSKVGDYEAAVQNAKGAAKNATDLANDYSAISESTGGYWNKAMRNIPGTDEQAFAQKLETLKSQVFLTQVEKMKGMGALTDMEGQRLEKSIASLDADLDPKTLQANLKSISSELTRAANKAQKMAELYATRGTGYSDAVVQAAKKRGVSPYEMQKIANEMGY
jgi:hypothetical protein